MKKVGILFAILFLLTSCTSGTVSEDPPCPVEDDRQSTLQELLAENPIDASIKLPTTDPSNREDHNLANTEPVGRCLAQRNDFCLPRTA